MIPIELTAINQWVGWRYSLVDGKVTKVPKNPSTGGNAATNNPESWASFEQAIAAQKRFNLDGVGLVLTPDLGIVGMDADHVLDNGRLADWAAPIVETVQSYTEITPSGTGLRIFVFGELPPQGRKKGDFECYNSGRFLTVTGNHWPGTPLTVECRAAEVLAVHKMFWPAKLPAPVAPVAPVDLADAELLRVMQNSKVGPKFSELWAGNINGYSSHSEADLALTNYLAWLTGNDGPRIDRFFRQSGLMREKWDTRHSSNGNTYGQMTINSAIAATNGAYTPPTPAINISNLIFPAQATPDSPDLLWPHYTLDEGLKLYAEAEQWLIYGLWQQDSIGMIFGDGASGKTYLAINQCVHLACGLPWLSDKYPTGEPKKIIYFISEGRRHFFPRVLAAVNGLAFQTERPAAELKALVNKNLLVVTDVPQLYNESANRSIESYLDYWRKAGQPHIDYTVIDTLHRAAVGSDENSERDANVILENVRRFVRETGAASTLLHHSNKMGGYRGSSAYRADTDVMLKVEGFARSPRTVTVDKEKDSPPDGPVSGTKFEMKFYIDPETDKSFVQTFLNEAESPGGNVSKLTQAKAQIEQLLDSNQDGLTSNQICGMVTGCSRPVVLAALDEMRGDHKLRVEPGKNRSLIHYPL